MIDHTPGPWTFNPDFCEITHGDTLIALVAMDNGDSVFANRAITPPDEDTGLANGELLSQAPTLVATVKSQRELIAALAGALRALLNCTTATPTACSDCKAQARAALARVEASQSA